MRRAALLLALIAACTSRPPAQETLKFWAMGHEGEVVTQMLPEFTRRTGIRVDVQQIPWSAAHEKLLTAYVGESTPDVAQLGNTWIPEFNAVNALEPLAPFLSKSTIGEADYFPGIWATNVVDNAVYGIPWYVDTRVLFYRTDLVPTPPRSWDEWLAAMQRVKAQRPNSYAILLPTNEYEQVEILAMGNGATLLNAAGTEGAFHDPRFAEAFRFYVDLFRRGYAPVLSTTQVANVYQGFAQGDFAMYITGPWNVGEFRKRLPPSMNGKWSTAPMPAPHAKDYPGASMAGGSSFVIFRASKKKDAAWKLIEFLSQPEQQIRFYELTQDLPAHRDAWKAPAVANDPPLAAFRVQLEHVSPLPRVPEYEQIATDIARDQEAVIRGRMTIEQALNDLDAKADRRLAKRRWVIAQAASR
ncbi:MAG TPA: sugar ABC transporter substrate-binding protein [Thermoanaerobaculia bacterium]|nr:sugar ABC transporter substrate-binding protein [Thermoanaerobaculia bacterium]